MLALVLALVAMAEEPPEVTLRAGKYIIGQEIEAGTYTLTCTGTDGEQMNDAYGALGSAFDKMDGSNSNDYSNLFGALGGLMENYVDLTVEIIGNYGDVLKKLQSEDRRDNEHRPGGGYRPANLRWQLYTGQSSIASIKEKETPLRKIVSKRGYNYLYLYIIAIYPLS